MRRVIVISFACSMLAAAPAWGQVPAFATLDRGDSTSRVGLDVGASFLDDEAFGGGGTALRFDVHGQYIHASGFGGYGLLPLSYASFENEAVDDEMALGNLEVGGLYALPAGPTTAVLRLGLTLPTASEELEGALANAAAVRPRGTDVATFSPESVWLRLGGSLLARSGNLFVRGDLGIDVPLTEDYEIDLGLFDVQVELDPLIRFNVGGGVVAGPAAIMAELVNIYFTGDAVDDTDPEDGDDQELEHNLALTGRYFEGNIQPSLSFVLALDDNARDDYDFMLMFGIHVLFPR